MAHTLFDAAEALRVMLISRATGGSGDDVEYRHLRSTILGHPLAKEKAPRFLRTCRSLDDFWSFIKAEFVHYQERRMFLREQFDPLLTALELSESTPSDDASTAVLSNVDSVHVQDIWRRALERRGSDPEGAITLARTLLEAVCKHILDERSVEYADGADLPKLYTLVAAELNLSPAQHTEQIFRQILGGCHSVVQGLGSLRNRISDAHGQGRLAVKPAPRHAELAVNLAGTMATFLVATWEAQAPTS